MGRDPNEAIAAEVRALQELSRDEAAEIARRYLAVNAPTVVTLKASEGRKRGRKLSLRTPPHDLGHRTPVDPALANRPAQTEPAPTHAGETTRVLANGLKVVLLPSMSVPTLEARLIFRGGTADDPEARRGVALIAANTLTWDLRHLRDALAFSRAGGLRDVDVSTDRTTFSVHGLDANVDLVLAGLKRWVCDGVYDDSAADFVNVMRAAKRADDQGVLTDAWRSSLFGANHPYVAAGLARHASKAVTLADAEQYRNAYFTPDNATLIVAGKFDPATIWQWIEYLFNDWRGRAAGHRELPLQTQPASLAKVEDTELVQIRIAWPARAGHAQRLVAAEMLGDLARDVRNRLGASYTFDAELAETRLASFYLVYGWVDAARAKDAVQLVRDRVAELRKDATAAARAFVLARALVLTRLRSQVGSAAALAARVEQDIGLWREPLSDIKTATEVQALTITDMSSALTELDLAHSTVLMTGPQPAMTSAFQVLARTPTIVHAGHGVVAAPAMAAPPFDAPEQRVLRSELTPALTEQPPHRLLLAFSTAAAIATAPQADDAFTGYLLTATIGYRYGWHNAIGAQLAIGQLTSDTTTTGNLPQTIGIMPVDLAVVWHLGSAQRRWGNILAGYHLERATNVMQGSRSRFMYGVEGGYDLVDHRGNRVGLSVRLETTAKDDTPFTALTFGVTFRR